MKYKTCPVCGSNLDPCERCDCMDEKPKRDKNEERTVTTLCNAKRTEQNTPYVERRAV